MGADAHERIAPRPRGGLTVIDPVEDVGSSIEKDQLAFRTKEDLLFPGEMLAAHLFWHGQIPNGIGGSDGCVDDG